MRYYILLILNLVNKYRKQSLEGFCTCRSGSETYKNLSGSDLSNAGSRYTLLDQIKRKYQHIKWKARNYAWRHEIDDMTSAAANYMFNTSTNYQQHYQHRSTILKWVPSLTEKILCASFLYKCIKLTIIKDNFVCFVFLSHISLISSFVAAFLENVF